MIRVTDEGMRDVASFTEEQNKNLEIFDQATELLKKIHFAPENILQDGFLFLSRIKGKDQTGVITMTNSSPSSLGFLLIDLFDGKDQEIINVLDAVVCTRIEQILTKGAAEAFRNALMIDRAVRRGPSDATECNCPICQARRARHQEEIKNNPNIN